MSEVQTLGAILGALWFVTCALAGIIWKGMNKRVDDVEKSALTTPVLQAGLAAAALQTQALDRENRDLRERVAKLEQRSDGHEDAVDELRKTMDRIETKLDRALGNRSPFPRNGE